MVDAKPANWNRWQRPRKPGLPPLGEREQAQRHHFLVSYDVSDKKRLRRMLRTLRGFGDSVQLSVFLCTLSRLEKALLEEAVRKVIQPGADQVLIVNLGPSDGRARECIQALGRPCVTADRQPMIL